VLYAKLVAANCRWLSFSDSLFFASAARPPAAPEHLNTAAAHARDLGTERARRVPPASSRAAELERAERAVEGGEGDAGAPTAEAARPDGSGRGHTFAATGLPLVYTLECNYNIGKEINELAPPHRGGGGGDAALAAVSPRVPVRQVAGRARGEYTPATWRDVGRALGVAALDICGANPASRLGPPDGDGLARAREAVARWAAAQAKGARRAGWAGKPASAQPPSDDDEGGSDADESDAEAAAGPPAAPAAPAAQGGAASAGAPRPSMTTTDTSRRASRSSCAATQTATGGATRRRSRG
jgi:hypothetical protein